MKFTRRQRLLFRHVYNSKIRDLEKNPHRLTAEFRKIRFGRKRFSPFRKRIGGKKLAKQSYLLIDCSQEAHEYPLYDLKRFRGTIGWNSVNHEMSAWLLNYSPAINRTSARLPLVFAKIFSIPPPYASGSRDRWSRCCFSKNGYKSRWEPPRKPGSSKPGSTEQKKKKIYIYTHIT